MGGDLSCFGIVVGVWNGEMLPASTLEVLQKGFKQGAYMQPAGHPSLYENVDVYMHILFQELYNAILRNKKPEG